jgi:drug/metabolite transporter (DMT)-like permease
MEKSHLTAYLKALFTVIVWGASFIATKVALRDVSPVTVVWLRFAIGVLILGLAVAYRKQLYRPSWKDLAYFALLGFIGITYHQWLQSTGLKTAEASTTAWIVASTPVFIAILGWLFLKEQLKWDAIIGIVIAAVGVLLVVSKGDLNAVLGGSFGTVGDKLILLSAPNWAVFSVLSRSGLKNHRAATMMFYVMTLGWLFSSVQFFAGPGLSDIANLTWNSTLGIAFLGIACSGIAYIFWYDALQDLPATQVGVFLYLEPLVAVVVSASILSEEITIASLAGGLIILAGVWIVNRPRKQPNVKKAVAV